MHQFAPVAPISILEGLFQKRALGNYHLVLSHDVNANKLRFTKLFNEYVNRFCTVIVDNSVIELKTPVTDVEQMASACDAFNNCQEVVPVLPDVLLDCDATIDAVETALEAYRKINFKRPLMFVPQGKTWQEIVKCAEHFQDVYEIWWIGIARNFVQDGILGSREQVTKLFQAIYPRCKFHLLGFSNDLIDDVLCTRLPNVRGIDSAVPLRINSRLSFLDEYPGRGNWWETATEVTDMMLSNLTLIRGMCEQGVDR